jgi:DNA-binding MarR family transcriptional regulator
MTRRAYFATLPGASKTHARPGREPLLSPLDVISVVCHRAPMRATDIEPLVTLDKSALSRNLSALVALGLVRRRVSPQDARAVEIEPTSKGRKLHLRVAQQVMQVQADLLQDLPEGEVKTLFLALQHLQDRLEARGSLPVE